MAPLHHGSGFPNFTTARPLPIFKQQSYFQRVNSLPLTYPRFTFNALRQFAGFTDSGVGFRADPGEDDAIQGE